MQHRKTGSRRSIGPTSRPSRTNFTRSPATTRFDDSLCRRELAARHMMRLLGLARAGARMLRPRRIAQPATRPMALPRAATTTPTAFLTRAVARALAMVASHNGYDEDG